MDDVCYTLEKALEKAIESEQNSVEVYRRALKQAKDPQARTILRELALEELEHKQVLEKSLLGETLTLHEKGEATGPSMNLSYFLKEKPLDENAKAQDVMIYAVHDEKRSVDFYQQLASQCAGAPMAGVFSEFARQEKIHLTRLEEVYERLYMGQM